MFDLLLFGEKLFTLRTPAAVALMAAAAIALAAAAVAGGRSFGRKRAARLAAGSGGIAGLAAFELAGTTSMTLSLAAALGWIAETAIAAAAGGFAFAAASFSMRELTRRTRAIDGERALHELSGSLARLEASFAHATVEARRSRDEAWESTAQVIGAKLEAIGSLRASLERAVLVRACRAPLDRALEERPPPVAAVATAAEARKMRAAVADHLASLSGASAEIARERDGLAGSTAARIGVPARELAEDALGALAAMTAAYERVHRQLGAFLARADADREGTAVLRLVHPDPQDSHPTSELKLAEGMIAAEDLSASIALSLSASDATRAIDRELRQRAEEVRRLDRARALGDVIESVTEAFSR